MAKEIDGKIFEDPEENTDPLSEEEKARILAAAAEFNRIRDAIPPERQRHLPEKFGGEDRLGTPKEAEYLTQLEERKKRGEYWG
ncbi:hypothetical protein [Nocardia suismassiliense]|uniref:hypothetical protein n=1 Tax=Nocardia suismassiliense TaxID=2077092 RepID=UPI000D1FCACA|nr:hypothetical protein [Nocardia suismassiliense]